MLDAARRPRRARSGIPTRSRHRQGAPFRERSERSRHRGSGAPGRCRGGARSISSGPRLAWATRAWLVAIIGYAVVVVPTALAPDSPTAAPEAGLAIAASRRRGRRGPRIHRVRRASESRSVGWPQAAARSRSSVVVLASFGFVGDIFDGRWRAPDGWAPTLSFTEDALDQGQFRILWIGDAASLPLDPVEVDATMSWSMTRNGPGDARELVRAPVTREDGVIDRALLAARAGQTSRLGRMLAPAGVRYVALALRNGVDGERGRQPPGVSRRARQPARPDTAGQRTRPRALREPVVGAGTCGLGR